MLQIGLENALDAVHLLDGIRLVGGAEEQKQVLAGSLAAAGEGELQTEDAAEIGIGEALVEFGEAFLHLSMAYMHGVGLAYLQLVCRRGGSEQPSAQKTLHPEMAEPDGCINVSYCTTSMYRMGY